MKKKQAASTTREASTDFTLAARLASEVSIADFRMLSCNCGLDLKRVASSEGLPKKASQKVRLQILSPKSDKSVRVLADFFFEARYPDQEEKSKAAVSIEAKFALKYNRQSGKFTPKEIDSVGHVVAALHSWPYWREFLNSTMARMGLPAITVPLLNVYDLIEDKDD